LWTFRELLVKGDSKLGNYTDAVARYLLIHLGFSIEDIDEANRVFWQRLKAGTMGDLGDAVGRIADFVKDNDWLKNYVVSSMTAMATIQDSPVTAEQIAFIRIFQDVLDMRLSQFESALDKGQEWGIALNYVVSQYALAKGYIVKKK